MKKVLFLFSLYFYIISVFCQPNPNSVIVLGLDGLDATLVQEWIQAGYLPNLQKLSEKGSFQELATSNPAQSPVAWATMITGTNPGKHNIFDFLRRGEGKYHPQLGLVDVEIVNVTSIWINLIVSVVLGLFLSLFWFTLSHSARKPLYHKIWIITIILTILIFWIQLNYTIPKQIPWPKNLIQGKKIWNIAGEYGISSKVLDAPMAFPVQPFDKGKLYCGLGVPDVAGTNGLWFRYSSLYPNPIATETGGWKLPLQEISKTSWNGNVLGPKNLLAIEEYNELQTKLTQTNDPADIKKLRNRLASCQSNLTVSLKIKKMDVQTLQISIGNISEKVKENQWTNWIPIAFKMNKIITIHGITRIRILQVDPPELYMSPIQFHPEKTPWNIDLAYPSSFTKEISQQHGLFPTLGWPEATNALKDEEIPEEVFWEDMQSIFEQRKKIFLENLQKKEERLLLAFFYAPDRASHMYWRFIDPDHPQYHEKNKDAWKSALLKVYQWCDDLVGETLQNIDDNDMLIVISDHGFASFNWEVNLNTWLYENGYLVLQENTDSSNRLQIQDLYEGNRLGRQVDWQKTRAYGMGLGGIYLNIRDRDPQGIVEPGAPASELAQEIIQKLKNIQHNGKEIIHSAYTKEELYHGEYTQNAPDIVVGFHRGYRVAWQSTLGAVSKNIIEPNLLKWSGDHCSISPTLIPGILFCNYSLPKKSAHLLDITPTILDCLGVPIPTNMDGQSLWKK